MRPVLRLFPKPKEVELTTEKFSKNQILWNLAETTEHAFAGVHY